MNRVERDIAKLKFFCDQITKLNRHKARSKVSGKFESASYWVFKLDIRHRKELGFECYVYKMELSKGFGSRMASEWTEATYDVLLDSWDNISETRIESLSEIKSSLRAIYNHGMENLKFGKYKKEVTAIDFFDFKKKLVEKAND